MTQDLIVEACKCSKICSGRQGSNTNKSTDPLGPEDIGNYQLHLTINATPFNRNVRNRKFFTEN